MPYRIPGGAYSNFTGELGQVAFENGVTVGNPPQVFLDRIAASFGLVDAETGAPAGLIARMSEITAVPFVPPSTLDAMTAEQIATANKAALVKVAKTVPVTHYTEDELGKVADKDGIAGLREIAGPYGVKGKSIPGLIQAILLAQQTATDAQKPAVFELSQSAKESEAKAKREVATKLRAAADLATKLQEADAEEKSKVAADAEAEALAAEAAAGTTPAVQVQG